MRSLCDAIASASLSALTLRASTSQSSRFIERAV